MTLIDQLSLTPIFLNPCQVFLHNMYLQEFFENSHLYEFQKKLQQNNCFFFAIENSRDRGTAQVPRRLQLLGVGAGNRYWAKQKPGAGNSGRIPMRMGRNPAPLTSVLSPSIWISRKLHLRVDTRFKPGTVKHDTCILITSSNTHPLNLSSDFIFHRFLLFLATSLLACFRFLVFEGFFLNRTFQNLPFLF